MTAPPKDSVNSGVVTLRSIRLALLAAELNGLGIMAGDAGNAYLEAETKERSTQFLALSFVTSWMVTF